MAKNTGKVRELPDLTEYGSHDEKLEYTDYK